jgi:ABC-type multidrug transport system ATPase subunit
VELICHDLVVIIKGEIRYSGPVANFLYDKGVSFQVMVEGTALPSEINGIPFQRVTSSLFLLSGIKEEDLSSLISLLIQKGMKIMEVKRSYTTLETRFLELLKGGE